MRHYRAYYDDRTNTWRVIGKDDGDDYFFNVVPDAGAHENATEMAELLNQKEVSD
jgi:hypothetical protein